MKNLYCLFDKKSQIYHTNLMVFNSDEEAKRVVYMSINQVPELKNFGCDYELYRVATFDTVTGSIQKDFEFIENVKTIELEFNKAYKKEFINE